MKYTFIEKYIIPFLITLWILLSPVIYWFTAIGIFMICDLVLKLIVCKRKLEPIQSEKLWRTVYKLGYACIFLIAADACQYYLVKDMPVMQIIAIFMIVSELKSIDEKAKDLTGASLFNGVLNKFIPKK